ncbi:MAG: signal peptidase II, partial [Faecalispora jeddahensis]
YVVDYIHFQFFPPVFNFADICVTVGCALLVIYLLFFADDRGRPKQPGRYAKYAHYNQNRNHRMGG